MKKQNIIVARRLSNKTIPTEQSDGTVKPVSAAMDWDRLRAMTDEEVTAAAMSDPDAQPLSPEQLRPMRRVPFAKTLRRALAPTQEEFAPRYYIPLGTLRDWEQGRCEPDQPARAYLKAIAHDPEGVQQALEAKPVTAP